MNSSICQIPAQRSPAQQGGATASENSNTKFSKLKSAFRHPFSRWLQIWTYIGFPKTRRFVLDLQTKFRIYLFFFCVSVTVLWFLNRFGLNLLLLLLARSDSVLFNARPVRFCLLWVQAGSDLNVTDSNSFPCVCYGFRSSSSSLKIGLDVNLDRWFGSLEFESVMCVTGFVFVVNLSSWFWLLISVTVCVE